VKRPHPHPSPALESIDRRLAATFLLLATALMVIIFFVGSGLFLQEAQQERRRLAKVIAHSMGPSFEVAKRAGEYRMQQLARQMREGDLGLEYIRIVGAQGEVLVAEGDLAGAVAKHDVGLRRELLPLEPGAVRVRVVQVGDGRFTEVAYRLQGGYQNQWVGILRVGLRAESTSSVLFRAGGIIGGVLALLLLASWPVLRWVSGRLAAPIQTLAQDFEGVMRHAPLHITIENAEGRIEKASATFRSAFGVHPDVRPPASSIFPVEALSAEVHASPEVPVTVQGEQRTFLMSRFPVAFGPDGRLLRAGLIGTDVTAWRQDQAQRDQLAAAVENTADPVLISHPDAGILYANPAFFRQTGYLEAEILKVEPARILLGEGEQRDEAVYQALQLATDAGEGYRGRIAAHRKDGSTFLCDLMVSPIAGPEPHAYVWMGRDVSRESQLELQLRQSQKMEAVGRLAGGVAHDFNNLLTVINGVAALLLEDDLNPEQADNVKMVADAGNRAAGLTRQLLAFGRRQVLTMREIDLNEVVRGTMPLLEQLVGNDAHLQFSPAEGLWVTRADAGQMAQVLMNLAINAKDAVKKGGRISIATRNATLDGGVDEDGTPVVPGEYVVLTVADNGEGMDEETQAHIFEPFYTTKAHDKGTGLGLPTVHGIVRQCGGHVWVFSTVGLGATFRIAFPRVQNTPDDEAQDALQPAAPSRGEVVLVVEDNEGARVVIEQILERAGYEVVSVRCGEDALDWLKSSEQPPHLVLTDLMMPGMGGAELARQVLAEDPEQPVLYMSGYSADAVDLEIDPARLLQKPPSTPALLAAVRGAIAERSSKAG